MPAAEAMLARLPKAKTLRLGWVQIDGPPRQVGVNLANAGNALAALRARCAGSSGKPAGYYRREWLRSGRLMAADTACQMQTLLKR